MPVGNRHPARGVRLGDRSLRGLRSPRARVGQGEAGHATTAGRARGAPGIRVRPRRALTALQRGSRPHTAGMTKNTIVATAGSSAFAFVLTMGIVNLFADVTYEGAASINGPFLGSLGAGAATISIVAGLGEFLGYGLRSVSGYISDRTGKYWLVTF